MLHQSRLVLSAFSLRRPLLFEAGAPWTNATSSRLWGHSSQAECSENKHACSIHNSARNSSSEPAGASSQETISVTYVDKDNKDHTVQAPIGKNLLVVAHDNEIDLEGACECSLACSTCHVIVEDDEYFKKMPEACEDELDMLDLAFGLSATSRLGCQIIAAKELDGMRVRIPSATRNFYVDGHKPKPH